MRGFWDALLRVESKDGCLILPEPYVWDSVRGRKIFVRDCYKALADAILRDAGLLAPGADSASGIALRRQNRCWTILGNPGPFCRVRSLT